MKFFKYLFFLLLIVFIGVALYFGTQDGDFSVSETREMNAPPEVVFEEVNDFKNWQKWGSWMNHENLKINYPDNTSGKGAFYSWSSTKDGDGAMETVDVETNKKITQKIVFNGSLEDEGNQVTWTFEPINNGNATLVSWSMEGSLNLFEKIYFAIQDQTLEERVRLMYSESLKNLDAVLQKEMNEYSIDTKGLTNHSGGFYLYNTTASKQSEIGTKIIPMIEQITNFMTENNIPAQGNPFVVYLDWDEMNKTAIYSVGIHTSDMVILPDGSPVISGYMEASTAIKTTLTGNYSYLTEAWEATEAYIQKNGFIKSDKLSPFEIYVIKAPEEKNPSKWVTDIYIPIETNENEYSDFE
ncbi:MAG: SRPBCC family protein [Flavobacteriaceae bacterium]